MSTTINRKGLKTPPRVSKVAKPVLDHGKRNNADLSKRGPTNIFLQTHESPPSNVTDGSAQESSISQFTNQLQPTDHPNFFCTILPEHIRKNKSLPSPFRIVAHSIQIPNGTQATLYAEQSESELTFPPVSCPLKNPVAFFSYNSAHFNDLRFLGTSGRGNFLRLRFEVMTDPPLRVTMSKVSIKVTADGPREPRISKNTINLSFTPGSSSKNLFVVYDKNASQRAVRKRAEPGHLIPAGSNSVSPELRPPSSTSRDSYGSNPSSPAIQRHDNGLHEVASPNRSQSSPHMNCGNEVQNTLEPNNSVDDDGNRLRFLPANILQTPPRSTLHLQNSSPSLASPPFHVFPPSSQSLHQRLDLNSKSSNGMSLFNPHSAPLPLNADPNWRFAQRWSAAPEMAVPSVLQNDSLTMRIMPQDSRDLSGSGRLHPLPPIDFDFHVGFPNHSSDPQSNSTLQISPTRTNPRGNPISTQNVAAFSPIPTLPSPARPRSSSHFSEAFRGSQSIPNFRDSNSNSYSANLFGVTPLSLDRNSITENEFFNQLDGHYPHMSITSSNLAGRPGHQDFGSIHTPHVIAHLNPQNSSPEIPFLPVDYHQRQPPHLDGHFPSEPMTPRNARTTLSRETMNNGTPSLSSFCDIQLSPLDPLPAHVQPECLRGSEPFTSVYLSQTDTSDIDAIDLSDPVNSNLLNTTSPAPNLRDFLLSPKSSDLLASFSSPSFNNSLPVAESPFFPTIRTPPNFSRKHASRSIQFNNHEASNPQALIERTSSLPRESSSSESVLHNANSSSSLLNQILPIAIKPDMDMELLVEAAHEGDICKILVHLGENVDAMTPDELGFGLLFGSFLPTFHDTVLHPNNTAEIKFIVPSKIVSQPVHSAVPIFALLKIGANTFRAANSVYFYYLN